MSVAEERDDWRQIAEAEQVEIARLRGALKRFTRVYERPAGRGKAVEHLIDKGHEFGTACFICDALAPSGA